MTEENRIMNDLKLKLGELQLKQKGLIKQMNSMQKNLNILTQEYVGVLHSISTLKELMVLFEEKE